jgi:magnesium transporter
MSTGIRVSLGHQQGGLELVEQWRSTNSCFLWLDIEGSVGADLQQQLIDRFELDPVDLNLATLDRHPPRHSSDQNALFVLTKPLDADSHSLEFTTQQLAVFVGADFIITRHSRRSPFIETLLTRIADDSLQLEDGYTLLAALLNRMVERYGQVLLDLESRLDEVEDELMDEPDESHMRELVGYNTGLRKMRRILSYHTNVISAVFRHVKKQGLSQHYDELTELTASAERFSSLAELYQNVINDLIDGYISLNGHHLNQVMRVLTVVTVLFLPLSLLVGIYGMNFENMPELKSPNGYFALLSVMAGIVTILMLLFRRKNWL